MTQDNRCENCGRKHPCEPCATRARQALGDALLDRLDEMTREGQPLILWFDLPMDIAWQHLNRLAAEWPGAMEVIQPTEVGDMLGCRVSLSAADIGKNPRSEWEVTESRVTRIDDERFQRAMESLS